MPENPDPAQHLLSPYRVLDLTDQRGLLCGKILADLGADVVQVEPPSGSPARKLGPFYQDQPEPEKSLYWWSYAANKRGITLDLETGKGKELLLRLAATAHFVIESAGLGLHGRVGPGLRPVGGGQSRPGHGVDHPLRAGRPLRQLQRAGHCGHRLGRVYVADWRLRPSPGQGKFSPLLPSTARRPAPPARCWPILTGP